MAAPVDGRANQSVVEVLARALQVPRRAVSILSGDCSKHKRIEVLGIDGEVTASLLGIKVSLPTSAQRGSRR